MVARSAYAQLRYSPLLLLGTLSGMALIYVAPPALALFAMGGRALLGILAWLAMAFAFQPTLRFYRLSPLLGPGVAGDRGGLSVLHHRFRLSASPRAAAACGRAAPRRRASGAGMSTAADVASGKRHRDENFPVASQPHQRRAIAPSVLAFYRFARAADDVADHASAAPRKQSSRCSTAGTDPAGTRAMLSPMRCRCAPHWPSASSSPRHALRSADGLSPRRHQAALSRLGRSDGLLPLFGHARWAASCSTCMAKSESTWPAYDALCSALQVINHLQDCAKDFRNLNRVYIPLDTFAAAGLTPEVLAQSQGAAGAARRYPPARCAHHRSCCASHRPSRARSPICAWRLEIAVIQRLALTPDRHAGDAAIR